MVRSHDPRAGRTGAARSFENLAASTVYEDTPLGVTSLATEVAHVLLEPSGSRVILRQGRCAVVNCAGPGRSRLGLLRRRARGHCGYSSGCSLSPRMDFAFFVSSRCLARSLRISRKNLPSGEASNPSRAKYTPTPWFSMSSMTKT